MNIFVSHALAETAVRVTADAIVEELVRRDHNVYTPGRLGDAGQLRRAVTRQLLFADVVVILVDSGGIGAFELGFAEGAQLPVVVVAPEPVAIGGDLAAVPLVRLTGNLGADAAAVAELVERVGGEDMERRQVPVVGAGEPHGGEALRELLDGGPTPAFESAVAQWLTELGGSVELPPAGDHTYDFILQSEEGEVLVEAKRYLAQERVSAEAVHALATAVVAADASAGLLVSTSGFTAAAAALAASTRVVLLTTRELLEARSLRSLLRRRQADNAP